MVTSSTRNRRPPRSGVPSLRRAPPSQRKERTFVQSNMESPSSYASRPKCSRKHRYVYEIAAASPVSLLRTILSSEIRESLLSWNATGTAALALFEAYKLNRVDLWWLPSPGTDRTAMGSIGLEWAGSNDPSTSRTARAGIAQNAHIASYPPPHSNSKWWHGTSDDSDDIFAIRLVNLDEGTVVVDIEVDYVLRLGPFAAVTTVNTVAGTRRTALDNSQATPLFLADVEANARYDSQVS